MMYIIVVLVFTALINHAVSDCNNIDHSSPSIVYLQTNALPLSPLIEPPNFNGINRSCDQESCCVSSDNSEYLFTSIDDAFDMIEDLKNNNSNVLVALIGNETTMTVYDMQKSHSLVNLMSFLLQSFSTNTSLLCSENVSLSLGQICNATIQTLSLLQCGRIDRGGITIGNVLVLNIDDVVIAESASSGIVITYNSTTPFCSSNERKSFNFINSTFIRNGKNISSEISVYGGGIDIRISIDETVFEVNVIDTQFIDNNASVAGGFAYSADTNFMSYLRVLNSQFIGNHGFVHGGAVHVSGTNIHFENILFVNNTAIYTAGAIYQFIPFQADEEISAQVEYYDCIFENNFAEGAGSLLITSSVTSSPETTNNNVVNITNSVFRNNSAVQRLFFGQTPCTVYSNDINLSFKNTDFLYNSATAVCIQSANIILSGSVNFTFNNGYLGGAINTLRSLIKIHSNTSVRFSDNRAIFGGAIYENGLLMNPSMCLFDISEGIIFNVTFSRNSAISRGNAIYFYEPNEQCKDDTRQLKLNESQVTSGATTIKFHNPVYTNDKGMNSIDLILGQYIVFNVTVRDFFNTSSFSQVNIVLKEDNNSMVFDAPYTLEGFRHISLENGFNRPNLSIAGQFVNNTQNQYKLSVNGDQHFGDISVYLKSCPLGFIYDKTKQQCLCIDDDSIACDFTLAISCIKKGFWIGNVDGINSSRPSVAPCASLYCQNNDNCSLCPITDTAGYCLLPPDQCLPHRDGFLCTECKNGYAFTFGGVKCVKDSSCNHGKGVVPAFLNVMFLLFTIILLIVVLKLDYKLSSGYLFCFIYYFSIVRHLLNPVVVGDGMLLFVSILTSVTQLNPQFLGYMQICFSTDFTILQQQAFLYFNPVVISIFVLLVIGISRCFSKYIKFADNTVVKAICLLLLLSFTALTETSFSIINPVEFSEIPNRLFVNIEPSTEYFNTSEHLPWFIIALVTVVFLVIPFTLLLLFAPILNKCFNLNKIKPFLDEFQGCYKDKFRWVAGYYFLARFIYLIILTAPRYLPIVVQYMIQLLSFLVLVIHMLLQPYQNNWLNFADSLLLADLVLVTLLFGSTAGVVFKSIPEVRIAIIYILILVPIIYFIVVIIVTIGNRFFKLDTFRNFLMRSANAAKEEVTHTSVERERSPSNSVGLREPLLDMMDDDPINSVSISPGTVFRPREKKRRAQVSYSVVGSLRSSDQEKGLVATDQDLEGNEESAAFKYRSMSVSSQSWLSETVSVGNESL